MRGARMKGEEGKLRKLQGVVWKEGGKGEVLFLAFVSPPFPPYLFLPNPFSYLHDIRMAEVPLCPLPPPTLDEIRPLLPDYMRQALFNLKKTKPSFVTVERILLSLPLFPAFLLQIQLALFIIR